MGGECSTTKPEGLPLEWTLAECLQPGADADADGDGVEDECEYTVAAAFAPLMMADSAECNWDRSVRPARLGGEYLYAVEPGRPGTLRIAYLPAYYRDCGWRLSVCTLTQDICAGHVGDSELIVVDILFAPATGRWITEAVFLSAHCHGASDGNCRWYSGTQLRQFRWADNQPRGAPVVWIARGKHANYPSRVECEAGYWWFDGCEDNRTSYRYPIVTIRQNIGSRARPFRTTGSDCIGPNWVRWGSAAAQPETRECPWSDSTPFNGWQTERCNPATTGYSRYLREVAQF